MRTSASRLRGTPFATLFYEWWPDNLIRFTPIAFVPQCQERPRWLPSPSVFHHRSLDFTPPCDVPPPPIFLNFDSIPTNSTVEPRALSRDFPKYLRKIGRAS